MNISKELLEKAKTAKTAEELLELAKAENIELTAEQAKEYFATIHASGELSDEELDNVAGGCDGFKPTKWKYNVGDCVIIKEQVYSKSDFTAVIVELLPDPNIGNGHGWYKIKELYTVHKSVKNGQLKKRASYGRIKTSSIGGILYAQRISTHTRLRKRNIGTTLTRKNGT